MRARVAVGFVALALAAAAPAGDRDFDAVVRGIESHYGIKRASIPMFGPVRLIVKVARPSGVQQLDMALFEKAPREAPDAGDIDSVVERAVSQRWRPVVRIRSRDGESSYVYYREDGRNFRLLVACFDGDEAGVVQLSVPPDKLAEWLREPAALNGRLSSPDRGHRDHSNEY
jgi:hypothetical protein